MPITDWPAHERPRERLLAGGAASLSDAELLAIFLRVGVSGMSAVDLARSMLEHFDNRIQRLIGASIGELSKVHGIGPAKAAQLKATLELARRALAEDLDERNLFESPTAVRDWLKLQLGALRREVFWALWLDARNRLIAKEELFVGTLTHTSVFPREIVRRALEHNAAAVLFAHNHPSGAAEPSSADLKLTDKLRETLALIDVKVLDHFIVAGNAAPLSFAERGLL
jgi:DNA repair protein RadC